MVDTPCEGVLATPDTLCGRVSHGAMRRRSPPSRALTRRWPPPARRTPPRQTSHGGTDGQRRAEPRHRVRGSTRNTARAGGGTVPLGPRDAATRRARRKRARHGRPEPRHARALCRRPNSEVAHWRHPREISRWRPCWGCSLTVSLVESIACVNPGAERAWRPTAARTSWRPSSHDNLGQGWIVVG